MHRYYTWSYTYEYKRIRLLWQLGRLILKQAGTNIRVSMTLRRSSRRTRGSEMPFSWIITTLRNPLAVKPSKTMKKTHTPMKMDHFTRKKKKKSRRRFRTQIYPSFAHQRTNFLRIRVDKGLQNLNGFRNKKVQMLS